MERETWLKERQQTWARRNRILNVLMALAIVAVLVRYCSG
jgi:hypothetical protein